MIIDIHCHLRGEDIPSAHFNDVMIKFHALRRNEPEERARSWRSVYFDTSGDKLVRDLDESGIDKAAILPLDVGLLKRVGGEGKYSIREVNRIFAKAAENHPDRLLAFVGVDPRRPEALSIFETGVKEWGMKGLKLLTCCGFYPDDQECYPLYEKALELGVPVLVHTGPEFWPWSSKYSHPDNLCEIAVDFPDLKIIAAHAGYCWWPEAAIIANYYPNIYLDLAQWQGKLRRNPIESFYKPLREMLDTAGAGKILFGTDWPSFARDVPNSEYIKAFKEPPESVKAAGIEFTEQEVNAILGDNAARLLGL